MFHMFRDMILRYVWHIHELTQSDYHETCFKFAFRRFDIYIYYYSQDRIYLIGDTVKQ